MKKEKKNGVKKKGTLRIIFGFSKHYRHPKKKQGGGIKKVPVILKSKLKI